MLLSHKPDQKQNFYDDCEDGKRVPNKRDRHELKEFIFDIE